MSSENPAGALLIVSDAPGTLPTDEIVRSQRRAYLLPQADAATANSAFYTASLEANIQAWIGDAFSFRLSDHWTGGSLKERKAYFDSFV